MGMKKKVLMLASGGPDCIVGAAVLKSQGFEPDLLHFNYGQKASVAEHEAVQNCAEKMGFKAICVPVPDPFNWVKSSLLQHCDNRSGAELVGRAAFVPGRNLIFVSIGAAVAASFGYSYVAHGNIADGAYPDNKKVFTELFDQLLRYSFMEDTVIRCIAPVNDLTKMQLIKVGTSLKVPFESTWSCRTAEKEHCGQCASCVARQKAFREAHVDDPTKYTVCVH